MRSGLIYLNSLDKSIYDIMVGGWFYNYRVFFFFFFFLFVFVLEILVYNANGVNLDQTPRSAPFGER